MPCNTATTKFHTQESYCGGCCPNRFGRLEWTQCLNYNIAVIMSNHHDEGTIRVCRHLGISIAVKPLATILIKPHIVHKARLQDLQRFLGI